MRPSPGISIWEYSTSLMSAERGDLENEFIEITEDEANQIVERHPVTGKVPPKRPGPPDTRHPRH